MQTISIPSFPICCRSIPSQLHHFNHPRRHHIHKPHIKASLIADKCSYTLPATSSCSKQHYNKNNHPYSEESCSAIDNNSSTNAKINNNPVHLVRNQEDPEKEIDDKVVECRWGILTNMKWTDLKAAFGQRINLEGIVSSASVFFRDKHLALPHVAVADIRSIDWGELKRKGFKGVVFDKDNTLTAPYSLALWPSLGSSLEQCKSVFGGNIAIFSNSAGLQEYDPDGSKAKLLEEALGIKVIRHQVKKPAGTADDIERHFGCESEKLVMVGDRRFTDIVFGNRNGFLTILTDPLTSVDEPLIVQQMRKVEASLSNIWCQGGVKPTRHNLLPDPMQCVKDPPAS
ncbi:PGP phosphatase, mitochondrial/chloroplastic [Dillenia turbinata]|uniref:PGP phosphatase, mitochondrial/chloroplastic n=1 Tax=Dillenia turbinata TaxID=194707 RepID=A0AAN8UPG3_9MAGN